ncbi:MAG: rod shape-determining protein [Candidatus Pacebacteria bacterium]|nr:rod shape-determining protein [Candidatus Paceibacterota bacterium]
MFNKLKENFFSFFSNDIGIDLGTANALVYIKGLGVVIDEPSTVAYNNKTGTIIAVGFSAKEMVGRTPEHITTERPIIDGVISNFEIAGEMIAYLINKAEKEYKKKFVLFGPRVVIGVPSGITNVEARAVRDAAIDAGARKVYIVEEPMAAAIGSELPVKHARGTIIVDIGGGTTDIAVIALGGVVNSKKIVIAGDRFNRDIEDYMKEKFRLLIGENTAEMLKLNVGSVTKRDRKGIAKGRDLVSGLAREVEVTSVDIKAAMKSSIDALLEAIREVIETTPPEVLSDSIDNGIYLSGGGALIDGLHLLISKQTKLPVHVVDDPLMAVVNGTGIILEDVNFYKETILSEENEGPIII